MNIHSGKVRSSQTTSRNKGNSLWSKLAVVFRLAAVLAAVGLLADTYIYLNQKIAETGREIDETRKEIHKTERLIESLVCSRNELTKWPHIRNSIQRFGLKLKPAPPEQVRALVFIAPGMASKVALTADVRSGQRNGLYSRQ